MTSFDPHSVERIGLRAHSKGYAGSANPKRIKWSSVPSEGNMGQPTPHMKAKEPFKSESFFIQYLSRGLRSQKLLRKEPVKWDSSLLIKNNNK